MRLSGLVTGLCFAVATAVLPAYGATITNGFTFAVANSGDSTNGSHFHSSTGGEFGNPAGKAEVGTFVSEDVRGLSEYNLTGLGAATSAFVTFRVFDDAGLFAGTNDFAYLGNISVNAYLGDNLENVSDFQASSTGFVGTFSTVGLPAGNTISLDITAIFNAAIAASDASLGIRLAIASPPNGGAFTFDTFRLTTDDQTSEVPIPGALVLLGSGLAALGLFARRRKKQVA